MSESAPTLFDAAKAGDTARVQELLDGEPSPDDDAIDAAIRAALEAGLRETVLALGPHANHAVYRAIEKSPTDEFAAAVVREMLDGEYAGFKGSGCVVLAASMGRIEVLKVLLDHGGDPNELKRGKSALNAAKTYPDVVKLLKAAAASTKSAKRADAKGEPAAVVATPSSDASVETPAVAKSKQETAEASAIEADRAAIAAGTMTADSLERRAAIAAGSGQAARLKVLLDAGAPPDHVTDGPTSLLKTACSRGFSDVVRVLLAAGASPDFAPQLEGSPVWIPTPFADAISNDFEDCALALVEGGADIQTKHRHGYRRDDAEVAGMNRLAALLDAKGAPREPEETMELSLAAQLGRTQRVAKLLAANPEQRVNKYVYWAVIRAGQREALRLLTPRMSPDVLVEGISTAIGTGDTQDRRNEAVTTEIVRDLLATGLDLRAMPGSPPLLVLAARYGRKDVVELLLAHGADPDAAYRQETALGAAAKHPAIVDLLTRAGALPPKQRAAERKKRIAATKRDAYRATLADGTGEVRATRVGGHPWLADGETWPVDASGKPESFLLQIDLDALPETLANEHGSGLLRVFESDDGESRVLVAAAGSKGDVVAPPKGVETRPARHLTRASALKPEMSMTDPDSPDWNEIKAGLKKRAVSDGDKVGGWPRYRQEPPRGMPRSRLVLQLDDETSEMEFVVQLTSDKSFAYFRIRG